MPANITRPSLKPYGVYPVHDILTKASLKFPDKTAIIDGNSSYTFSELEEYSSQFSGALKRLGVSKGDRVGILAPNCAEFVIALRDKPLRSNSINDKFGISGKGNCAPGARQWMPDFSGS